MSDCRVSPGRSRSGSENAHFSRSRVDASARSSSSNSCVRLTLFVQLVRIRNRTISETISSGGFSSASEYCRSWSNSLWRKSRIRLGPGAIVGQDDTCAWHAFECKGRSSIPNAEDRRKAKRQAQRLVRVDSTDCSLHVGAVSYFRRDELEFHWRDPDTEDAETLEPIKVTLPEDAWRCYYAPALALATAEPKDARTAADVKLEVHDTILDLLLAGDWAAARSGRANSDPRCKSEVSAPTA